MRVEKPGRDGGTSGRVITTAAGNGNEDDADELRLGVSGNRDNPCEVGYMKSPDPSRDQVEKISRMYSTSKEAALALGLRWSRYRDLCQELGVEIPGVRKARLNRRVQKPEYADPLQAQLRKV